MAPIFFQLADPALLSEAARAVQVLTAAVRAALSRARSPSSEELTLIEDLDLRARVALAEVKHWQATVELADDAWRQRCLLRGALRTVWARSAATL